MITATAPTVATTPTIFFQRRVLRFTNLQYSSAILIKAQTNTIPTFMLVASRAR
jgi:hypothetical protein